MTTTDDTDSARLIAWARAQGGRIPGHAITRDEHDRLMAGRDRPLTVDLILRHHKGDSHNDIGGMA